MTITTQQYRDALLTAGVPVQMPATACAIVARDLDADSPAPPSGVMALSHGWFQDGRRWTLILPPDGDVFEAAVDHLRWVAMTKTKNRAVLLSAAEAIDAAGAKAGLTGSWRAVDIELQFGDERSGVARGSKRAKGEALGAWAVHKNHDPAASGRGKRPGWNISHVTVGQSAGKGFVTEELARATVEKMNASPFPWRLVTAENVKNPEWKAANSFMKRLLRPLRDSMQKRLNPPHENQSELSGT